MTTPADIMEKMPAAHICVVTGGEPLLNQNAPAWPDMLHRLRQRYRELHLETNGTLSPTPLTRDNFDVICVSPKQGHAGSHRGHQNPVMHPDWVGVRQAVLKIVVLDASGVKDAVVFGLAHGFPLSAIWVMPEGRTPATLQRRWPQVAQAAADLGVNACHRLHVLAWNDERGH